MLYIFWFLHQTTTNEVFCSRLAGCISFDSYIKPQLFTNDVVALRSCISFDSYIKPQLIGIYRCTPVVVYLLIPTSNHNPLDEVRPHCLLYIFWFLHQTTTSMVLLLSLRSCISFDSYIKPQLFEMNPGDTIVVYLLIPTSNHNCRLRRPLWCQVVYLLIPTSNHNPSSLMR